MRYKISLDVWEMDTYQYLSVLDTLFYVSCLSHRYRGSFGVLSACYRSCSYIHILSMYDLVFSAFIETFLFRLVPEHLSYGDMLHIHPWS